MKQHVLRHPLPTLSRGGYGEMVAREMGREEEEEEEKRNGGKGPFIPPTHVPSSSATGPSLLPVNVNVTCIVPSLFAFFVYIVCIEHFQGRCID